MSPDRDNEHATGTGGRERLLWLVAMRALVGALVVLAVAGGADAVGLGALTLSGVVVVAMARRCRADLPGRSARILLTAGVGVWYAGSLAFTFRIALAGKPVEPKIWDLVGWFSFYPLAASALIVVARRAMQREHGGRWDGAIAALSVAAVAITAIVEARRRLGTDLTSTVSIVDLLWDIVLLTGTVGMAALLRWRSSRFLSFLIVGFASFTAADVAYCAQAAFGAYDLGSVSNVGYAIAVAMFGHAVWEDVSPAARQPRSNWRRILMPIALAALPVLVLANGGVNGHNPIGGALALAALGVVLARLAVAYRDTQQAYLSSWRQARTDLLTGLGNRHALGNALEDALGEGAPAALLLADLDGFKAYNDTYGHHAGDELLARMAGRLVAAIAPVGTAFRIGGDEFCVLARAVEDPSRVARRVQGALHERGPAVEVGCSIGFVALPREAHTAEEALKLADERMYAAKHGRRGSASHQVRDVLLGVVRERDRELSAHGDDVARLAAAVAQRLGLSGDEVLQVEHAAELHDIGKVAIPDTVLDKPGPLDAAERSVINRHTVIGERILAAAPGLAQAAQLVRSSHERWDGGGYPDGLAADAIPLGSRIIAVCDAWDAMTTDRPYRAALPRAEALAELARGAGKQFDPAVIDAFQAELVASCALGDERSSRSEAVRASFEDVLRSGGLAQAQHRLGAGS